VKDLIFSLVAVLVLSVISMILPTVYAASYDGLYDYWFTMFNDPDFDSETKIPSGFVVSNNKISSNPSGHFSGSVTSSGSVSFSGVCPPSSIATAKYSGTISSNGEGKGTYDCYYNGEKRGGQGDWRIQKIGGTQNTPSTSSASSASDWNKIGNDLLDQKKYEEAINAYDKALQIDSNYKWAWNNKASALNNLDEYDDAITAAERAIQIDPNYSSAWYQKGLAQFSFHDPDFDGKRDFEKSLASFKRSIELDPNRERSYYWMGEIMMHLDDYEQAIVYFEKALEIDPDFEFAERKKRFAENQLDGGGGCLIATATYGSELAPQVQQLRELRDNSLLNTESGSAFMESFNQFYYSFSPTIADLERENPIFKEAVKVTITPLLSSLSLLNYVDIDSEIEVLGYGISLILLNIGMYFVVPAMVFIHLKKRF